MFEKNENLKDSRFKVLDYLQWCEEGEAIPNFKGYTPFRILMEEGKIIPYLTTIRRMQMGSIDPHYYVNEYGFLVGLTHTEEETPMDPEDLLSEEKSPNGWEPFQLKKEGF